MRKRRERHCGNSKCNDRLEPDDFIGRIIPICPACRYLAKWVWGATVAGCAGLWFVFRLWLKARGL